MLIRVEINDGTIKLRMGDAIEDNGDDEDDDDEEEDGLGNNFGEIGEPSSQRAPVAGEPVRKISVTVCFVLLAIISQCIMLMFNISRL